MKKITYLPFIGIFLAAIITSCSVGHRLPSRLYSNVDTSNNNKNYKITDNVQKEKSKEHLQLFELEEENQKRQNYSATVNDKKEINIKKQQQKRSITKSSKTQKDLFASIDNAYSFVSIDKEKRNPNKENSITKGFKKVSINLLNDKNDKTTLGNENKTQLKVKNKSAITGFVLGLIGILFLGFIFGIIGIVKCKKGLNQIKNNPDRYKTSSKVLGIIGLAASITGIVIWTLVVVLLLLLLFVF